MRDAYAPFLTGIVAVDCSVGVMLQATFDRDAFTTATWPVAVPPSLETAVLKRRAEFTAGRLLANMCHRELGRAPSDIAIGPDRGPIWPDGMVGSITHSDTVVACWVIPDPAYVVGIDVEPIAANHALRAIQETVLSAQELALTGGNPAQQSAIFSAKETLFKALRPRVGQFFGFDAAATVELGGPTLTLELLTSLSALARAGDRYEIEVAFGPFGVRTRFASNVALHRVAKPG